MTRLLAPLIVGAAAVFIYFFGFDETTGVALLLLGGYLFYRASSGVWTGIMRPLRGGEIDRYAQPFEFWMSVVTHGGGGAALVAFAMSLLTSPV